MIKQDLSRFKNLTGLNKNIKQLMALDKIEKDHYYHIFNRGINSSIIFKNEDNMSYFLKLIKKHLIARH